MLDFLISADKQLFLTLNGAHGEPFDFIMYWASNRFIWIPFYAFLLYVLIRLYGRSTLLILVLVAGMITVSDQVSSGVIKTSVKRLRPCHDPEIQQQVFTLDGHCGGQYGFISSHAANGWALAVFMLLLVRKGNPATGFGISRRWLYSLLFTFVILVSYSRIYLGVHFPGDILGGAMLGIALSFIFAKIFFRIRNEKS